MRKHTLEATGGQTYAQMGRYLDANGKPTNDENKAAKDAKTGQPVENGLRNLWVTETALTTALNTASFAEQVATFAIVMGFALLLTGIGFLVLTVRLLVPVTRRREVPGAAVAAAGYDPVTAGSRLGAARRCLVGRQESSPREGDSDAQVRRAHSPGRTRRCGGHSGCRATSAPPRSPPPRPLRRDAEGLRGDLRRHPQLLRALALRRRRVDHARSATARCRTGPGAAEPRRPLVRRAAVRRLLAASCSSATTRPIAGQRANSGVQVRFPAPQPAGARLPDDVQRRPADRTTPAWIAVNCGHEIQINDSPDGAPNDPRKTGSIYGFADLDSDRRRGRRRPGTWNDLEIRVVGQHYTVDPQRRRHQRVRERARACRSPAAPTTPGSDSRGLVGYVGLQSHGGPNDVVSFRNVRIKDLSDRD